eukprot:12303417-Karenia_brevis.AAC.2
MVFGDSCGLFWISEVLLLGRLLRVLMSATFGLVPWASGPRSTVSSVVRVGRPPIGEDAEPSPPPSTNEPAGHKLDAGTMP